MSIAASRLVFLFARTFCCWRDSREGQFPERTAGETSVAEDDAFFSSAVAATHSLKLDETAAAAKNNKKSNATAGTSAPWMETVKSLVPTAFSGKVGSGRRRGLIR